ncbi:uncharacterized protein LOC116004220 [Ipomoea triloba]|uniref:uncharacterized protein LOC116004220 n=1 Tax=Ipomoea triloba TaxID=35885 RepID=UPI00125E3AEA|nr:uncharacterized protein LOC116004220 [Ipomoea triloba]
MRDRGKAVEIGGNNFTDFTEMPCKKHPSCSSVGICPQCLKDRLVKLVCSECGEQRLSSCSCSDISSSRISFLIENEKGADQGPPPPPPRRRREKTAAAEEVIVLRRSSSSCVEIKKSSNGFWKIKRLFARGTSKREKSYSDEVEEEEDDDDHDHAHQVFDEMRVSRSRSLCSFRDEGSDQYRFSSAKISDVTGGVLFDGEEPRKSGFRGGGGGEKANFPFPRSVFPVKESDFSAMDESAFIDIKLDLSSSLRLSNASDHDSSSAISLSTMKPSGNGMLFGSCRITGNGNGNEFDKGMKRSGKGNRVWKWISRQSSGRRSASKKDDKYY